MHTRGIARLLRVVPAPRLIVNQRLEPPSIAGSHSPRTHRAQPPLDREPSTPKRPSTAGSPFEADGNPLENASNVTPKSANRGMLLVCRLPFCPGCSRRVCKLLTVVCKRPLNTRPGGRLRLLLGLPAHAVGRRSSPQPASSSALTFRTSPAARLATERHARGQRRRNARSASEAARTSFAENVAPAPESVHPPFARRDDRMQWV